MYNEGRAGINSTYEPVSRRARGKLSPIEHLTQMQTIMNMHVSPEDKYSAIIAGEQHLGSDHSRETLVVQKN